MIIIIAWLILLPDHLPYFDIVWHWTANADLLFEFRIITDILDLNDHPVFSH